MLKFGSGDISTMILRKFGNFKNGLLADCGNVPYSRGTLHGHALTLPQLFQYATLHV